MCPWLVQRGDRSLERPSCNLFPMGSNLGPWDPDWGFFPKCNTLTLMPKYLKTQLRAQRICPRTAGHFGTAICMEELVLWYFELFYNYSILAILLVTKMTYDWTAAFSNLSS